MQVKTKNLMVGALVVLLVGMLWYRVVYSPMESKASKAKTAAHNADLQSAQLRTLLKGANTAKKNAKSASTAAMNAAVPSDPAEASFLRSLDALRVSSGIEVQSVSPANPAPSTGLTSMTVSISAQGTEDEIARYLEGLSTMPRLFIVDNVSIAPGGSASPAGSAAPTGHAGAVFIGDSEQVSITGRIFSSAALAAGATTKPAAGATAPTGVAGAGSGTVNG